MDFSKSEGKEVDDYGMNVDSEDKWENFEGSDKDNNETDDEKGNDHFGAWMEQKVKPRDRYCEDRNAELFDLRRVAMEHQRPPFPDFQFEVLDNEVDTDDNDGDFGLAAGSKRKPPSRMDSWEDNWLFQQRKPNVRTATSSRPSLVSTRMYDTIDEQHNPPMKDNTRYDSDASEKSGESRLDEVRRVERPCVRTSSSSSDAEDSEESDSSDSPCENVAGDSKENIQFLPASSPGDPVNPSGSSDQFHNSKDSSDEHSATQCFGESRRTESSSENSPKKDLERNKAEGAFHGLNKSEHQVDEMSDGSIKDEVTKHHQDKRSNLLSDSPLLPALLIQRSHSPGAGSGTRSCASEDSSSDEFEKMAAAYKPRRRASWCPLETPGISKKRGKRRPLLPLKLNENDEEQLVDVTPPLANHEEGLVGLERQMLHRNVHHSSFRAKKASPNFVLNPLYVPEGDGPHNPREQDLAAEPVDARHLNLPKSESGYSSCSSDSQANQNTNAGQQGQQNIPAGPRLDAFDPMAARMQPNQKDANPLVDFDPSFLW